MYWSVTVSATSSAARPSSVSAQKRDRYRNGAQKCTTPAVPLSETQRRAKFLTPTAAGRAAITEIDPGHASLADLRDPQRGVSLGPAVAQRAEYVVRAEPGAAPG